MMSKFTNGKSVYQDSTDSGSDDGSVAPMNNLSLDSPSSFSTAFAKIPYCCNDDIKSSGKITKPGTLLKGNLRELFAFFYLTKTITIFNLICT